MEIWEKLRNKVTITMEDLQKDPRFRQSLQDAKRAWSELEREVELIRRQLKENASPVVDDTKALKDRLDAFRQRSRGEKK